MVRTDPSTAYPTEFVPPVWRYPRKYGGALVLGNLLMAVMMRNELFGRLLYLIVNTCFAEVRSKHLEANLSSLYTPFVTLTTSFCNQRPPLWFRLGCTSVLQHLGGIHSGCAVSGFAWLIFKVALTFISHSANHDAVLITGVLTNIAVAVSILSALPWVRNAYHK